MNIDNFVTMRSLREYMDYVVELKNKRKEDKNNTILYFRGQSDRTWKVEPSVARNDLYLYENIILKTALSRCSSHFKNIYNYFDLLTEFQHYGLPTRLLDVTTNPLVALYFACCTNQDVDGIVYNDENYLHYNTEQEIQILSLLSFELVDEMSVAECLDILLKNNFYNNYDKIKGEKHNFQGLVELLSSAFLVQANYNNERINRQSGLFILPSLFRIENSNDDVVAENSMIFRTNQDLSYNFKYGVIIDRNIKEEILDELSFYNINESSLFPDFENQLLSIGKSFKKLCDNKEKKKEQNDLIENEREKEIDDSLLSNTVTSISSDVVNAGIAVAGAQLASSVVGLGSAILPFCGSALPVIGACIGGAVAGGIGKSFLTDKDENNNQVLMDKINESTKRILRHNKIKEEDINHIESIKLIDWYKKESLLSQLKLELREILKNKVAQKDLKNRADSIMKELQNEIDKLVDLNESNEV